MRESTRRVTVLERGKLGCDYIYIYLIYPEGCAVPRDTFSTADLVKFTWLRDFVVDVVPVNFYKS